MKDKEHFEILPSAMNFPLSVEELALLEVMECPEATDKNLLILIKALIKMTNKTMSTKETSLIKQFTNKLANIQRVKPIRKKLPKYISYCRGGYSANRIVNGKKIFIKQSKNLAVVKQALLEFNKKHNLK